MREDEPNWFSKWEEQLPKPEELVPISQTLILPDLAIAFDIERPHNPPNHHHHRRHQQPPPPIPTPPSQPTSRELDSSEPGGDDPGRTLKRSRLVWTPQLHKRFVDAVAYVGFRNAVPKTVMQIMNIEGITRENVASHLQKYRQYVNRMSSGDLDPVTDRLFASSPVPPQFLHEARPNSNNILPHQPANGKRL